MALLERLKASERISKILFWMYTPIDGASVAVFRMMFGAIIVWEVWRYFDYNWISSYFTGKDIYFTYPLFHWVHPWPSEGLMELHFLFVALCGLLVAIGFLYRPAALGLFLSFTYVFLLEEARYLNHFYFVSLVALAMVFIPAHRTWSVDTWLRQKYDWWPFGEGRAGTTDQWGLWYIRLLFGITYFYGGIAKLNEDWLRGYPLSDWIADDDHLFLIGPYVHEHWMGLLLSYAGLLLDLAFVPLLLWKKTRWLGFALAIAFNLMNAHMFSIGIFPWVMIGGTLTFFDAGWPRKVLKAPSPPFGHPSPDSGEGLGVGAKVLAGFLAVFTAYQLLFPLRHWLYPGSVHWTEEGHKFSWHMKLRSKRGRVKFVIKDPIAGTTWSVQPDEFLNDRQEKKMSARPDMILFFAHWLRDYYKREQGIDVEVYADSWASLNGREYQRLIDPSVNLSEVEWSVWHSNWIVPLHTPLHRSE